MVTTQETLEKAEAHGAPQRQSSDGAPAPSPPADRGATMWQEKLLPFMTIMVAGMAIFFFLASLGQLIYLHRTMFEGTALLHSVPSDELLLVENAAFDDQLANRRWHTLAALDLYVLQRRYHQANVLLMARTWVRYLGFVTGMILALVGATFILGKLRESESKVEASGKAGGFLVQSESPGILLAALGVVLMVTTIVVYQQIKVEDTPLFTPLYNANYVIEPVEDESDAQDLADKPPVPGLPDGANLATFGELSAEENAEESAEETADAQESAAEQETNPSTD